VLEINVFTITNTFSIWDKTNWFFKCF